MLFITKIQVYNYCTSTLRIKALNYGPLFDLETTVNFLVRANIYEYKKSNIWLKILINNELHSESFGAIE